MRTPLANRLRHLILAERGATCRNHPSRRLYARGVCRLCYYMVLKRIQLGEISEAEAVEQGLFLAARKWNSRPPMQPCFLPQEGKACS